jgi:hypothetical protein
LPPNEFGHAGHVRAAYLYLESGDFVAALARMRRTIRNYARHLGKPERYHETITVAYVALIHEYMHDRGAVGWPVFARRAPELFEPDLLLEFYSRSQLESETARSVFVLPRRAIPLAPDGNRPS